MEATDLIHRITRLPKQARFVDENSHRYNCYSGSRAAGKTYGLCVKLSRRASVPGSREGLYRMNYSALMNSTLITLLEGDNLPPVLPPGSYRHDKQKHRIDIHGGGSIFYGGFDKGISSKEMGGTGSMSSMNLSGAAIDEAVEIYESQFVQLDGAVRMPVPGLAKQLYMACNPAAPSHWIARRFGLGLDYQIKKNHWAIRTNIYDNFTLDRDYVDAFAESLQGVAYKRYIWGLWVGSEGVVYPVFNRDFHVVEPEWADDEDRIRDRTFVMDPGTNDPCVIIELCRSKDRHVHLKREFYETGHSPSEMVDIALEFMRDHPRAELIVDSAEPGLIKDLRKANLNARGAKKGKDSINRGIARVGGRLKAVRSGKGPGFTVSPYCPKTIAEFETYEWKKTKSGDGYKDEPIDAHNHAMDAIRYGIERIDRGSSVPGEVIEMKKRDGLQGMDPSEIEEMAEAMEEWTFNPALAREDPNYGF